MQSRLLPAQQVLGCPDVRGRFSAIGASALKRMEFIKDTKVARLTSHHVNELSSTIGRYEVLHLGEPIAQQGTDFRW